jgi:hypothetical protein
MKTCNWFNRYRPLAHLRFATSLLLACSAPAFNWASTPAAASDRVPFYGTVLGSGSVPTLPHVENTGIANQLGAFTGSAEFYPDLSNLAYIPYTGIFDWFAANGDEIYGTFEGYLTDEDQDFVYDNHETATVAGGTGRFASATGTFYLGGLIDFTAFPDFSFALPWHGWISTVGSNKRR